MLNNVKVTLNTLTRSRLREIGRIINLDFPTSISKADQVSTILRFPSFNYGVFLREFTRDELQAACRKNEIDDSGRSRIQLARRLLTVVEDASTLGQEPTDSTLDEASFFSLGKETTDARLSELGLPSPGQIVLCRQKQYLVEEVIPKSTHRMGVSKIRLVCLEDDAPGRVLEVMWERELGARVIGTVKGDLGKISKIDSPKYFAAYLNALRWNCVTATDPKLFQAPFRAGIEIMDHQMIPLQKALQLPRANLFIADDVGLGKTIEAGLVLQELILRQRVNFTLIVCPASVVLQWRDEMSKRFGLQFEIYNRQFIARRRTERGFRANPWATHSRFIISHSMLSRPEHRDPLLQHIGEKIQKSLLILDEAHAAAPSSATKYATDSKFTKVIRDVAPKFENRLFLSATPHNGHSNSFAALLEILDPQRFTRGVPIESLEMLKPVMIRRLKSDLRAIGSGNYPERQIVKIDLRHDQTWQMREVVNGKSNEWETISKQDGHELHLAELLAEYTRVAKPISGRSRLVFVNLQKRLLSSIEAFHRTLTAHARGKFATDVETDFISDLDVETYGPSDEATSLSDDLETIEASKELTITERATALREEMLSLTSRYRYLPDAKIAALIAWMKHRQCEGVGNKKATKKQNEWTETKLLIFTEYGDTKRYINQQLRSAIEDTHLADDRIGHFHGGMSDEAREEIQRKFNDPNDPIRILIATDAAREGVNLQGACADLLHYDLPWNPARMEQRNGRIDRTLQPSPIVRCMYFHYSQRPEDRVLEVIVEKIDVIQRELGSLGTVMMEQIDTAMKGGIDAHTGKIIDAIQVEKTTRDAQEKELENQRDLKALKKEIDAVGRVFNNSKKVIGYDPNRLKDVLNVACEILIGDDAGLKPTDDDHVFSLPEFPESWSRTLDSVRRPKKRDEEWWEWRKAPLQEVRFTSPKSISSGTVHLHLEHPLVQRMLSRFRAQGFAANDLSRVTVIRTPYNHSPSVIAFARLSLFGKSATRLHDEILAVAAPWSDTDPERHLKVGHTEEDKEALRHLDELLVKADAFRDVPEVILSQIKKSAAADYKELWKSVEEEAEAKTKEALNLLIRRGEEEASALVKILEVQQKAIQKRVNKQVEMDFGDSNRDKREKTQYENDLKHMKHRLNQIETEITTEPAELRSLYEIELRRVQPVGLVYLWPESR